MIKLISVWLMKEKAVKPNFTHSIKIYIRLRKSYRKKILLMNFQDQEMKVKNWKNITLKMRRKKLSRFRKMIKSLNLLEETELECRI
jgi:hypothetical protein